jgi:hypothetical protein
MTRDTGWVQRVREAVASAFGRRRPSGAQPAASGDQVGRRIDSARERLKATIPPPAESDD